jgi:hypothetical protein
MDILTNKEIVKLIDLGKRIKISLDCDLNGTGLPSKTNRLQAVEDMKEYLSIHGCEIFDEDGKVFIKEDNELDKFLNFEEDKERIKKENANIQRVDAQTKSIKKW